MDALQRVPQPITTLFPFWVLVPLALASIVRLIKRAPFESLSCIQYNYWVFHLHFGFPKEGTGRPDFQA
jgi:hypothetical protein